MFTQTDASKGAVPSPAADTREGELRHVARWARNVRVSPLQEALATASRPEILSLSLGLPDPVLFPTAAIAEAASRVLADDPGALQYSVPSNTLRVHVCDLMKRRGVDCSPDEVFLTAGAQQGLSLLARLLLDPGAPLMEEEFSYTGFQQAVEPYSPQILRVRSSPTSGIDVEAVKETLEHGPRPALLYTVPDGHNPLGLSIGLKTRRQLASLAGQYQVPIVEDDPYGLLYYCGEPLPAIRAFERDWVYYVGSFSKLLAPALRVGWLVVPRALIRLLSIIKEAGDINTSTFTQRVVAEYLSAGALGSHLRTLCAAYGARRKCMDAALRASLPPGCRWELPPGGVFFWVELPECVDAGALLNTAIRREKVAFVPAAAFSRGARRNGMRLNFSRCNEDQIREAVARIGRVLADLLQQCSTNTLI